jgi:outer membrane protein assembly factor BamB
VKKARSIASYLPAIFLITGIIVVMWWILHDPTRNFEASEPGKDARSAVGENTEEVQIGEHFELFAQYESKPGERWPAFRGGERDNIYKGDFSLKDRFGGKLPEVVWSVEMGEGHAGAAIYDGLVYVLDYNEKSRADVLRCFRLEDGKEIWRRWYDIHIRRNHGMSRTVPAVNEKFIVTMGPRGHVMCVERETGNFLWSIDSEKEYKTEIPLWYTGQCPLIDNNIAIIAPGGDALLIGVDCATGKILWKTPNPNNWKMSHSSVMPYIYQGKKMYVYSASGGMLGVSAEENAGEVLWSTSQWNHPVVAASPVCMPDGKIFITAGYGAGSMLLQLRGKDGKFEVDVLKSFTPGEGLSSEQQTPVLVDGHLFGILPKDAKTLRNQLVCVKPDDPTQFVWTSGSGARFGLGPYILADNKFYILDDDATLIIIQKSTQKYIELDRIKLFDGHDAWAPLAIANGYMVLRDADKMICINLNK